MKEKDDLIPAIITIRRTGRAFGVIDHRTGVEWIEWSLRAAFKRQEWLV